MVRPLCFSQNKDEKGVFFLFFVQFLPFYSQAELKTLGSCPYEAVSLVIYLDMATPCDSNAWNYREIANLSTQCLKLDLRRLKSFVKSNFFRSLRCLPKQGHFEGGWSICFDSQLYSRNPFTAGCFKIENSRNVHEDPSDLGSLPSKHAL